MGVWVGFGSDNLCSYVYVNILTILFGFYMWVISGRVETCGLFRVKLRHSIIVSRVKLEKCNHKG